MKKSLVVMLVAALVGAAFVGPADAGKRKKKKPKVCKAYQPGEMGAEADTVVLKDTATEEEPVVHEFSLEQSTADFTPTDPSESAVNVQVDPKAKTTGLYATFEFPMRRDYDLWAYFADGEEAASSHGFNPLVEAKTNPPLPFDASNTNSNHGGESTDSSENLIGIITADCGGYTLLMQNWLGEGGDFELKLWLGEGQTEPGPPEEG
jgi:hypothetical protein